MTHHDQDPRRTRRSRPDRLRTPAPRGGSKGYLFADPTQFFDKYLSHQFARTISRCWCPEWRDHPEALAGVVALWRSREEDDGLADWLTRYAYPIMDRLSEPGGVFAGCNPGLHDPSPGPMKDQFKDWEEFYEKALSPWYARDLQTGTGWAWCPEWRKHPAAVARVKALHMAYETLRKQKGTGPAVWWAQYADPIMGHQLDPSAEFIACSRTHSPQEIHDLPA